MARRIWILFLSLLNLSSLALAQSCTAANARAIDADVAFLAYWEVIEVSWLAIADVKKRSLLSLLEKRDLVCASTEECLSFKGDPFCYDKTYVLRGSVDVFDDARGKTSHAKGRRFQSKVLTYYGSAHTFHAADGTTGNFVTGEYTLADGRVGNMYHGPYPTNTKAVAAVTQTASAGEDPATVTLSLVTVRGGGGVSTPVGSSGGVTASPTSQQGVISSKVGNPVGAILTAMPTPNSSTILKSSTATRISPFASTLSSRFIAIMVGVLLHIGH